MKQVLVFAGLKVAEITGVLILWYLGFRLVFLLNGDMVREIANPYLEFFAVGSIGVLFMALSMGVAWFLGLFLWQAIKANWKWAKRISK